MSEGFRLFLDSPYCTLQAVLSKSSPKFSGHKTELVNHLQIEVK
jgi:hypothetical protein